MQVASIIHAESSRDVDAHRYYVASIAPRILFQKAINAP